MNRVAEADAEELAGRRGTYAARAVRWRDLDDVYRRLLPLLDQRQRRLLREDPRVQGVLADIDALELRADAAETAIASKVRVARSFGGFDTQQAFQGVAGYQRALTLETPAEGVVVFQWINTTDGSDFIKPGAGRHAYHIRVAEDEVPVFDGDFRPPFTSIVRTRRAFPARRFTMRADIRRDDDTAPHVAHKMQMVITYLEDVDP